MTDLDRLDALDVELRARYEDEDAPCYGSDVLMLLDTIRDLVAAARERDELRAALETAGYRFDSIGAHLKPDQTEEDRGQVAIDWWFGSEEIRAALNREAGQ